MSTADMPTPRLGAVMRAAEKEPTDLTHLVEANVYARLGPRARAVFDGVRAAKAENAARRARVLKYDDLKVRLTTPPLSYKDARQWSGYVPPRTVAEDTCPACPPPERVNRGQHCQNPEHLARLNTSPERAALVEICAEAMRREQEETTAGA